MSKARELANLGNAYSDGALSNRNLIINGAMQVAQRGTSVTGVTSGGYRTCDRWRFDVGSSDTGAWTVSQASDGPEGFNKSMKVECTTAKADISTDWRFLNIQQKLEGQNMVQAKFGTANAESLTVSFWVKSNKVGTYTLEFWNDNSSYGLSNTFSVNSSGVWEKKTVTVAGDADHGFVDTNAASLYLIWWMAASPNLSSGSLNTTWSNSTTGRVGGSNVNLADTIGNYFQITGVQLEVGDTATPFEHRSYGQELALCQRYYQKFGGDGTFDVVAFGGLGQGGAGTTIQAITPFKGSMRTRPTAAFFDIQIADATNAAIDVTGIALSTTISSSKAAMITYTVASGVTQYRPYYVRVSDNANGYLSFDAEL